MLIVTAYKDGRFVDQREFRTKRDAFSQKAVWNAQGHQVTVNEKQSKRRDSK